MKKTLFTFSGILLTAILTINTSISIGSSDNSNITLTLSSVEALASGGECTASATKCTATCVGKEACISGETHVYCDGTFTFC